jgi:hypothetical protein
MNSPATNYSSELGNNTATFTRPGSGGIFYYETIQVNVSANGTYTFISNSRTDTYGYLYENNINASDLSINLLTYNDDSGGNAQFMITYTLQAGRRYILIFTTYSPGVQTPFSIIASGPARVGLSRINLILTLPSTSTTSSK